MQAYKETILAHLDGSMLNARADIMSIKVLLLLLPAFLYHGECCTSFGNTSTRESSIKTVSLYEQLFYGIKTEEFLKLCNAEKAPSEADMRIEAKRDEHSTCQHDINKEKQATSPQNTDFRKYTMIELFYLKQLQARLTSQIAFINSVPTLIVCILIFAIPFLMALILVILGGYKLQTLPQSVITYLRGNPQPASENNEGMSYKLYLSLSDIAPRATHPSVISKTLNSFEWHEYNKEDESRAKDATTTKEDIKKWEFIKWSELHLIKIEGEVEETKSKKKKRRTIAVPVTVKYPEWEFTVDRKIFDEKNPPIDRSIKSQPFHKHHADKS